MASALQAELLAALPAAGPNSTATTTSGGGDESAGAGGGTPLPAAAAGGGSVGVRLLTPRQDQLPRQHQALADDGACNLGSGDSESGSGGARAPCGEWRARGLEGDRGRPIGAPSPPAALAACVRAREQQLYYDIQARRRSELVRDRVIVLAADEHRSCSSRCPRPSSTCCACCAWRARARAAGSSSEASSSDVAAALTAALTARGPGGAIACPTATNASGDGGSVGGTPPPPAAAAAAGGDVQSGGARAPCGERLGRGTGWRVAWHDARRRRARPDLALLPGALPRGGGGGPC